MRFIIYIEACQPDAPAGSGFVTQDMGGASESAGVHGLANRAGPTANDATQASLFNSISFATVSCACSNAAGCEMDSRVQ